MKLFKKIGGAAKKFIVKPVETVIVRPVDKVIVEPVTEHVVNPIRETVDPDFAIRDEMEAYDARFAAFQTASAGFVAARMEHAKAKCAYERIAETFYEQPGHGGAQITTQPISEEVELGDATKLDDIFLIGPVAGYFANVGRRKEREDAINKKAEQIANATRGLHRATRELRAGIRSFNDAAEEIRAQLGDAPSLSAAQLDEVERREEARIINRMRNAGIGDADIARLSGIDPARIAQTPLPDS